MLRNNTYLFSQTYGCRKNLKIQSNSVSQNGFCSVQWRLTYKFCFKEPWGAFCPPFYLVFLKLLKNLRIGIRLHYLTGVKLRLEG